MTIRRELLRSQHYSEGTVTRRSNSHSSRAASTYATRHNGRNSNDKKAVVIQSPEGDSGLALREGWAMNKARFTAPTAVILGDPEIGEGTWIGHFCVLDGSQGLVIGRNCSIASGVHIYTHSTHELTTEGKPKLVGPVVIGDNVAIGANSVILHGCEIGDNVVILALTLLRSWTKIEKVKH